MFLTCCPARHLPAMGKSEVTQEFCQRNPIQIANSLQRKNRHIFARLNTLQMSPVRPAVFFRLFQSPASIFSKAANLRTQAP